MTMFNFNFSSKINQKINEHILIIMIVVHLFHDVAMLYVHH